MFLKLTWAVGWKVDSGRWDSGWKEGDQRGDWNELMNAWVGGWIKRTSLKAEEDPNPQKSK